MLRPPARQRRNNPPGKLRLLITLRDFNGWTPSALMDELRFDLRHRKDFDRIAIVGETSWQRAGTKISAPFFSGETRWFESEGPARDWLAQAGLADSRPAH